MLSNAVVLNMPNIAVQTVSETLSFQLFIQTFHISFVRIFGNKLKEMGCHIALHYIESKEVHVRVEWIQVNTESAQHGLHMNISIP